MTEEKLTKTLEYCKNKDNDCMGCPTYKCCENDPCGMIGEVLDLINRKDKKIAELTEEIKSQKAEIENLRHIVRASDENQDELIKTISQRDAEIERLENSLSIKCALDHRGCPHKKQVKSKAIKEFAERLKTLLYMPDNRVARRTVYTDEIDNLVKEMVGDTERQKFNCYGVFLLNSVWQI